MNKVVIVEDEELVRKGIVLTVDWQSVNCVVVGEAANGEDGLRVIRRCRPDFIITDIRMPRMDGLEMLRVLQEEQNTAHCILLTAYSDFSYAREALRLGASDYLLKPFRDGELEGVIRRLSQSRQQQGSLSPALLQVQSRSANKYVLETLRYISLHYNDPDVSVSAIARFLDISESHLSHIFKKETDCTLTGYLTDYRIRIATELLRDYRSKIYEVAQKVGYQDIAYFSSTFKKLVGVSPSDYQKNCQ